jgi:hypothetical protein
VNNGIDLAMLGNWIQSWVQPTGAIHGFHNHTVWGGNPYRWIDFTSGHSTWASPFLPGLALALDQAPDDRGRALLSRLLRFQTGAFQPDGNYAHIGFQVGETLKAGLIHNAVANISLLQAVDWGRESLADADVDSVRAAFLRNVVNAGRPTERATCNQDYARIWSKLLYQRLYRDDRYRNQLPEDLDFMIRRFHVRGIPDEECEGTLRSLDDTRLLEPAEYYGLMVCPLVLAFEAYGEQRYLEHAGRLCRHVVRSAWTDPAGRTRFHRLWHRHGGEWERIRSPMLISGMGDTLEGIRMYLRHCREPELDAFLDACLSTYARVQHPRGFFVPATGWSSEIDVAPSSAWHAHDFRALVGSTSRSALGKDFWDRLFRPWDRTAVLLGDQCYWAERGEHWSIADYNTQDVYMLLGRKDEARFGRDMSWIGGDRALPEHFRFPGAPDFMKGDDGILLIAGDPAAMDVCSTGSVGEVRLNRPQATG